MNTFKNADDAELHLLEICNNAESKRGIPFEGAAAIDQLLSVLDHNSSNRKHMIGGVRQAIRSLTTKETPWLEGDAKQFARRIGRLFTFASANHDPSIAAADKNFVRGPVDGRNRQVVLGECADVCLERNVPDIVKFHARSAMTALMVDDRRTKNFADKYKDKFPLKYWREIGISNTVEAFFGLHYLHGPNGVIEWYLADLHNIPGAAEELETLIDIVGGREAYQDALGDQAGRGGARIAKLIEIIFEESVEDDDDDEEYEDEYEDDDEEYEDEEWEEGDDAIDRETAVEYPEIPTQ